MNPGDQSKMGPGEVPMPTASFNLNEIEQNNLYEEMIQISFSEIGKDFDPFVCNDSHTVVYASTRISEKSDIFLKKADSKVIEQLTHTPNASEKQPQVSPDGQRVVYASDKSGKWNIYETSLMARGSREMELIRNERINEQPAYSPDGKQLAYATWLPRKGMWYIAIMDLATQQERLYGPGLFPKFSPDGKKLLFQKPRVRVPQWYSVWILELESQAVSEIISNDNWACITPNWSPDGSKIIFAAINKNPGNAGPFNGDDIYTIWEDGTHLMRLTSDNAPDWNPIWAKNGRIYYISLQNGNQNVWSVKPKDMDRFHPDSMEVSKAAMDMPAPEESAKAAEHMKMEMPKDLSGNETKGPASL